MLDFNFSGGSLQQPNGAVCAVGLGNQIVVNLGIAFGHLQVRVAHHFLEGEKITTILQIEGGKAVAELVGSELCPGAFTVPPKISGKDITLEL